MIAYQSANNKLVLTPKNIPQLSGNTAESISIDNYNGNYRYFLELRCPKNKKYITEEIAFVSGEGTVNLPCGVTKYVGDIFVQLVIRNSTGEIIGKSFVADQPLYIIEPSINAAQSITDESGDYLSSVVNAVNDMTVLQGEITDKLNNGDFIGEPYENTGEWSEGKTYYGYNNYKQNGKKISIATVTEANGVNAYSCKRGGISSTTNKPNASEDWTLLTGSIWQDISVKQDITDGRLLTFDKTVTGAINEIKQAVGILEKEKVEVVYDCNTKNIVGGVAYPRVLPKQISIDLMAYKKLKFYVNYWELLTFVEIYMNNLYGNRIITSAFISENGQTSYCAFEIDYHYSDKILFSKIFSKKMNTGIITENENGTFGINRIEGVKR